MEGIFTGQCAGHWSSSDFTQCFNNDFAWSVEFDLGGIYRNSKTTQRLVRCVH